MKNDERILELPQPIIDRLREVTGRIRRMQWIKGSLLTFAAGVGALLAGMALDAAFSLEFLPLRWLITLAVFAFTASVAWRHWLRPLSRRISLRAVASWLESRHPEWQERISTVVELLDERHGSHDEGSRQLLEGVVLDAVKDLSGMNPALELSARRTLPAKWLAGSMLGFLILLLALWPRQVPRLLVRALAPMSDVGNAWAGSLRVLTGDQTIAAGDPLTIAVAVRGGRSRVELQMKAPDGPAVTEVLSRDGSMDLLEGETGYALRIPAVAWSFTAKIAAGKAVSAAFSIKVVPRPEAGSMTITYNYPAYTGLPAEVKSNASGEIQALAGTSVAVHAALSRPAAKAYVKLGEADGPVVKISAHPDAPSLDWSTILKPDLDTQWSLHLEDGDGIANRPVQRPIRSIPDQPPQITLEMPAEDRMELRPVEKVDLVYSVREDIGLSSLQIRIRPQDQPEYLLPPEILPEKTAGETGTWQGTAVLDLSKLLVPDGQEIKVSLMVADRLPAEQQGPQRAYSREIAIRLNQSGRPQVERNFAAQYEALRKQMEAVKNDLQDAKGRIDDKPERLQAEEKLSENTLKDLEATNKSIEEAQSKMEELTDRMKDSAYARQTPEMQKIRKEMLQPAGKKVGDIPMTDQKEKRAELARDSKDLLEKAIQQLETGQRQMDQDRKEVEQVARLSDIAEQQQRLAGEAGAAVAVTDQKDQTGPAIPAAPSEDAQRKWLEEQRRVAVRANELMKENLNSNPQTLQDQLKRAGDLAAQLGSESGHLAERESNLAFQMLPAATPEIQQQNAAAQQTLAGQVTALQEKAKRFQQLFAGQIEQTTESQEAADQAGSQLEAASGTAQRSGQELVAALRPAAASSAEPGSGGQFREPPAAQGAAAPAGSNVAIPPKSEDVPPFPKQEPEAVGQLAALQSAQSLKSAADQLTRLGGEFNSLAGKVGEHLQSLNEGSQQAGVAVEQAAKPQNEQGGGPSMERGAGSSRQAADQLTLAASTAMQMMSIPAKARTSQPAPPSKGKGKAQDGQPNEDGSPGQEGKDGLQMDTASSELPAELAKMGLSQDDWSKLRSALNGVDGASSEQIPAEYRDLVKAYFGALAKGGNAK